jgi:nicotinamidase-related amidase
VNRRNDRGDSEVNAAATALLLIDVINDLEFPDGGQLLRQALPMAKRIAQLKQHAVQFNVPVIYVNDNFGRWRSDFRAQVEHCLDDGVRGRGVARLLPPGPEDYFVLKPMHSGFYGTVLELLLKHLHIRRLVLCGIATNICVLFTASDAYMRGYELWVPADCVAANTPELSHDSLDLMHSALKADVRTTRERTLVRWDSVEAPTAAQNHLVRGT